MINESEMDVHGGLFNYLTWTQIQFVVEKLFKIDIHELPMPGDWPESDRYQKDEDKFL